MVICFTQDKKNDFKKTPRMGEFLLRTSFPLLIKKKNSIEKILTFIRMDITIKHEIDMVEDERVCEYEIIFLPFLSLEK